MRPVLRVFLLLLALFVVWLAACEAAARAGASAAVRAALAGAPAWALIALGCYALASVGLSFLSFRDCSSKALELQSDIAAANALLKKKGFAAPPAPGAAKRK